MSQYTQATLHDKITFLNLLRYTWLTVDTNVVICYSQQQGRHKGTHYVKIALQNFFYGEQNNKRTEQDSIQDHTFITVAGNVPPPPNESPSLPLCLSSLSVKSHGLIYISPSKNKNSASLFWLIFVTSLHLSTFPVSIKLCSHSEFNSQKSFNLRCGSWLISSKSGSYISGCSGSGSCPLTRPTK